MPLKTEGFSDRKCGVLATFRKVVLASTTECGLQSHFPRDLTADLVTRASQLATASALGHLGIYGEVDLVGERGRVEWVIGARGEGEVSRYSDSCKWDFFSQCQKQFPPRLHPTCVEESDDDSGANFICILLLDIGRAGPFATGSGQG